MIKSDISKLFDHVVFDPLKTEIHEFLQSKGGFWKILRYGNHYLKFNIEVLSSNYKFECDKCKTSFISRTTHSNPIVIADGLARTVVRRISIDCNEQKKINLVKSVLDE